MAKITSGVYPVFNNEFKIGTKCMESTAEDMVSIADLASNLGNLTTPPDTLRMESETTLRLYGSLYANALGTE